MNSRIVCAANRCELTKRIVIGIRHYDGVMQDQIANLQIANLQIANLQIAMEETDHFAKTPFEDKVTQGFVDQFGNFYNRQEAWKIAEQNGQVIRRVGGDSTNGGTLYSENLY